MVRYKNFDRLIMAHGTIIQQGGYEAFKLGTYQFVLELYEKEKRRKYAWSMKTKIGLVIIAGTALLVISRFFGA